MHALNVGVIGLGVMGSSHARVYDKIPFVNLKSVCDANIEKLNQLATEFNTRGFTDYLAMLDDPDLDAVSICLPDNMHVEAIKAAISKKKHILVEKPLANTVEDAIKIYDALKDYDRVFTVGYNLRFDPRYSLTKQNISEGKMGDIISVYCRRNSPITGPLRFVGFTDLRQHVMVHDINVVNWFMPSKPVKVFAKSRSVLLKQYDMTDTIFAIVTYEDGSLACFEACWVLNKISPSVVDDKLEVIGTKGTIYTDSCDCGFRIISDEGVKYPDSRYRPVINGLYGGALYEELTSFINCIIKNTSPVVSVEECVLDLRVVEAIERSIKEECEVLL